MKRDWSSGVIAGMLAILFVSNISFAHAYALGSNASSVSFGSFGASGGGFNITNVWNQLAAPFKVFIESLQSIGPIRSIGPFGTVGGRLGGNAPMAPQMQIPPQIQQNLQTWSTIALRIFSWIWGWIKGISNWLLSIVKT